MIRVAISGKKGKEAIGLREEIKKRFSVLPGYNHERDGIPIPQPRNFKYELLISDIVMHTGEIKALDLEAAENELQTDILPHHFHDCYFIGEV